MTTIAHLAALIGDIGVITAKEINGDISLGSMQGETLVSRVETTVVVPRDIANPAAPLQAVDMNADQLKAFIAANTWYLRVNIPDISQVDAVRIAYFRALLYARGLIGTDFNRETFNVEYNDCRRLTADEMTAVRTWGTDNGWMTGMLTAQVRKGIQDIFVDTICLVAFVFRVRGHHYMAEYESMYNRIWQKMRFTDDMKLLSFQKLAVHCTHAIFPMILEQFWTLQVQGTKCNGALIKRYVSAAAGTAGIFVVQAGLNDLYNVAPGIRDRLDTQISYVENIMERILEHRYAGSVNARYYRAPHIVFDESRFSATAAIILAAIRALDDDHPLLASKALQRIANNAPITGGIIGRGIAQLSNNPQVANSLIAEHSKG